jgi:anti-sigma factor RsiW
VTCHYTIDIGCYVLGSLDPAERAKVEEHIGECDACRAELVSLAGLPGLLSRVSPQEAAAGLPATPPRMLEGLLARAAEQRRTRRHRVLAAAAALILVAGGIATGLELTNPSGGGASTTATDGPVHARVWLVGTATGTKITLSLSGVPAGEECRLVAISTDGSSHDSGSWWASYGGDASVSETAALAPAEIAALRVETRTGRPFVTIALNG